MTDRRAKGLALILSVFAMPVMAQATLPILATRGIQGDSTGMSTVTGPRQSVSADGRYVVMETQALNLAAGVMDRNMTTDVYLLDRNTQTAQLVSRKLDQPGVTASGQSFGNTMTPDGRWVLFRSSAPDVVPGVTDGNGTADVFLFDRTTGSSVLVSRSHDAANQAANGASFGTGISDDGRYVLFESTATNIAPVSDFNNTNDLFLFDRVTAGVTLITTYSTFPGSAAPGQVQSSRLSSDGTTVLFVTTATATDLITGATDGNGSADLFLWSQTTGLSTLVSRSEAAANAVANGAVLSAVLSADGNWVGYSTMATNVVTGVTDTNATTDVYRWSRGSGSTELVSATASSANIAANGGSTVLHISGDGNWTSYTSQATDVVSGQVDTNNTADLFVRDQSGGINRLVSRAGDVATNTPNLTSSLIDVSNDGRYTLFFSQSAQIGAGITDGNGLGSDVFVFDRVTEATRLVSHQASNALATPTDNPSSFAGAITDDGRFVAFYSNSVQLVSNTVDYNKQNDAFLKDFQSGALTLLSRSAASAINTLNGDTEFTGLSDDGRWLLYRTIANNVTGSVDSGNGIDFFLFDRDTRATRLVSRRLGSASETSNNSGAGAISGNGRFVAYGTASAEVLAGVTDTNAAFDVFLFDRETNTTQLATTAAGQSMTSANSHATACALSADGNKLLYHSLSTNVVAGVTDSNNQEDVFVFDRSTGNTQLVSRAAGNASLTANDESFCQAISADGRWVVFSSKSTDLVAGINDANFGADLFLFDTQSGNTSLVSRAGSGTDTGSGSFTFTSMDATGESIVFASNADDLISGGVDSNFQSDVFLYRRSSNAVSLVSHAAGSPLNAANSGSTLGLVSADGRFVGFSSTGSNLDGAITDANGLFDAILFDTQTGLNILISVSQSNPAQAGNGASNVTAINADGSVLGVTSQATNLAQSQDSNGGSDAFQYLSGSRIMKLASRRAGTSNQQAPFSGTSFLQKLSADGSTSAIYSLSAELSNEIQDGNSLRDYYLSTDTFFLFADGLE
ncbi:hypothetical protein C7S18_10465 [Ahniella affigens]|uniref:Calcium-binding protein n=1 Tax=Ahniella affigens TaxID=2021234 RepID=A0A2P1PRY4_9GAMM|nr:hypothetical protein [Ahniella affigens]AVP97594.1 hypothetical protein C7S18_10465 [Ahniella affigens]